MKSNDVFDHSARIELVKCTGRELDAKAGKEYTFVDGGNDTRSDTCTVGQPAQRPSGWSSIESFWR